MFSKRPRIWFYIEYLATMLDEKKLGILYRNIWFVSTTSLKKKWYVGNS